jgi:Bifunctional DNA primase/polymerase, N-terminal
MSSFSLIAESLRPNGLWCFPIRFKPGAGFKKFDKLPLVKWKPYQNRPPTQKELDTWRAKYTHAKGAGIPTGPALGIAIIDADDVEAIEWLELRGMPETWLVRTRRGLQYYLNYPLDLEIHNSASAIAPGVDVRGIGGMVAAAGSEYQFIDDSEPGALRLKTFTYQWEPEHSPGDLPLAELPPWLMTWLRNDAQRRAPAAPSAPAQPYRDRVRAWARKAYDANLDLLRCAEPGTRNTACWNVARRLGQLCAGGELDAAKVIGELHAIANNWPNAVHTVDTINRAFKVGEAQPRCAPSRRRSTVITVTRTFDLDAPLGSESITLYDEPLRGDM